jgi:hypothetical protein
VLKITLFISTGLYLTEFLRRGVTEANQGLVLQKLALLKNSAFS